MFPSRFQNLLSKSLKPFKMYFDRTLSGFMSRFYQSQVAGQVFFFKSISFLYLKVKYQRWPLEGTGQYCYVFFWHTGKDKAMHFLLFLWIIFTERAAVTWWQKPCCHKEMGNIPSLKEQHTFETLLNAGSIHWATQKLLCVPHLLVIWWQYLWGTIPALY